MDVGGTSHTHHARLSRRRPPRRAPGPDAPTPTTRTQTSLPYAYSYSTHTRPRFARAEIARACAAGSLSESRAAGGCRVPTAGSFADSDDDRIGGQTRLRREGWREGQPDGAEGLAWPGDFCCRLAGGAGVTWCGIQIQSFGQSRTWSSASPLPSPAPCLPSVIASRGCGLAGLYGPVRPGAVASGGLSGHARGPASATSSPPVTRAFAAARKRPAARRRRQWPQRWRSTEGGYW